MIYHSYYDFHADVRKLTAELEQGVQLACISRGSLVLGTALSHALSSHLAIIEFQTRDGETKSPPRWAIEPRSTDHVIVLDDIYDTGLTLDRVHNELILPSSIKNVEYICLYKNVAVDHSAKSINVKALHRTHGEWVTFFWEDIK